MSTNAQIQRILRDNVSANLDQASEYNELQQTLVNVAATDRDNILYSWIVDIDPSQYVQSDGPFSNVGEWDVNTSTWYQQAVNSPDVVVTEPYLSTAGSMVVSIVKSVIDGTGEVLGFVAIDISTDKLNSMMENYKMGETGFFILTSKEGTLMHFPDEAFEGKNISEADVSQSLKDALVEHESKSINYNAMGENVYGYISAVGDTGWMVTTGLPEKEYFSAYNSIQRIIFIVFLCGFFILAIVIIILARGIISPLKKLSVAAKHIAGGELDVAIDVKTIDETGQVADALRDTVIRLKDYIKYIEEISQVLNMMATGNMVIDLKNTYDGDFKKIETGLKNISGFLNDTIGHINQSSDEVSNSAAQVSDGAQALSSGAAEQASSVEELAATINDISEQVKDTAHNADEASDMVGIVKTELEKSNEHMQEMINAMADINDSSGEIGKIIKTIEDIAFQTNILALNAAVEAARAGSAGKGFAVVADEVRNLASKSAEAAKDTTALIEHSIIAVKKGSAIATETAQAMTEVVTGAVKVTEKVQQIATASEQQALSIAQVTQGVDQISGVVQTNSATAEESAAASEELSSQAHMLKNMVERFVLDK